MLTDHGVLLLASLLLFLFFLHRIQQIKQAWQAFGNIPAVTLLVSPTASLGRILPHIPWITGGGVFGWRNSYESQGPLGVYFLTQLIYGP